MGDYCEHVFEKADAQSPEYSHVVIDLAFDVGPENQGYALRHNKTEDAYEIFEFTHPEEHTHTEVEDGDVHVDDSVASMDEFDIFPDVDELLRDESLETTITYANLLELEATGRGGLEYGHSHTKCPLEPSE